MVKLLIGGSPCTYWSIAQKKREVRPEGIGWELFKNYLIAKQKFSPDFFLYENNKSVAREVKEEIAKSLGVGNNPQTKITYINSNLVSAQNRQRFYVTNFGNIEQPLDRGILLKDIIQSGHDLAGNKKAYALTATYGGAVPWNTLGKRQRTMIAEPVMYQRPHGGNKGGVKYGKSPTLTASSWENNNHVIVPSDGVPPLYIVYNGKIEIRGKTYPVNLPNGVYKIRKLSVAECCRLQTLPDDYCRAVSRSQAYKGLGNGWTAEVIIYLLTRALLAIPRDEKLLVLSMYDGIGTGRYCLDKMGFHNVEYHAYEIDKYAMRVALDNYPDIIQHGDAGLIRSPGWCLT